MDGSRWQPGPIAEDQCDRWKHRTLWQRDRLDWLSGFGRACKSTTSYGLQLQSLVSVLVDSKHYSSYSFAFVNDQAEQFRRRCPSFRLILRCHYWADARSGEEHRTLQRRDRLRWLRGLGMQESRQRCVKFVFLVGRGQFVLALGRLRNFICAAIRPSRRRVSSSDGQQWRSVTSSLGSHIERFRSLNTSFPCTSWHILDHAWCSVIVHAPGTQMGKRATGCCRTWDQKLSSAHVHVHSHPLRRN